MDSHNKLPLWRKLLAAILLAVIVAILIILKPINNQEMIAFALFIMVVALYGLSIRVLRKTQFLSTRGHLIAYLMVSICLLVLVFSLLYPGASSTPLQIRVFFALLSGPLVVSSLLAVEKITGNDILTMF